MCIVTRALAPNHCFILWFNVSDQGAFQLAEWHIKLLWATGKQNKQAQPRAGYSGKGSQALPEFGSSIFVAACCKVMHAWLAVLTG